MIGWLRRRACSTVERLEGADERLVHVHELTPNRCGTFEILDFVSRYYASFQGIFIFI